MNVLVDVDLGLKRCGAPPGEPPPHWQERLWKAVCDFGGSSGYEGHLQPLAPGPGRTV